LKTWPFPAVIHSAGGVFPLRRASAPGGKSSSIHTASVSSASGNGFSVAGPDQVIFCTVTSICASSGATLSSRSSIIVLLRTTA
jgi:hypothetical protein